MGVPLRLQGCNDGSVVPPTCEAVPEAEFGPAGDLLLSQVTVRTAQHVPSKRVDLRYEQVPVAAKACVSGAGLLMLDNQAALQVKAELRGQRLEHRDGFLPLQRCVRIDG